MGVGKGKRSPAVDPRQELERIRARPATAEVVTCQCTLVTPMFGGGVKAGEVDRSMPIRATAVRGQLRFWWRLLNRNGPDGRTRDRKALFAEERAIWGGLGDGRDGGLTKSQVVVQVRAATELRYAPAAEYPSGRPFPIWSPKSKGYALFPAANIGGGNGAPRRAAELLQPGARFELRLVRGDGLSDGQWQQVLAALHWWAVFGGVGARTRRGLGALQVDCNGEPLLCPTKEELDSNGCTLVVRQPMSNAHAAWLAAIEKLMEFRQGVGVGRNPPAHRANNKSPAGRSRWPEPDTIRKLTGRAAPAHPPEHPACGLFPRAMFGLPIITHFKDKDDPLDTSLQPVPPGRSAAAERMASPLILRPLRVDKDQWAPAALLLPHEHVLEMGLQLLQGARPVRGVMRPDEWWQPEKASLIPPLSAFGKEKNPLEAFLEGFAQGRWPKPSKSKVPEAVRVLERPNLKLVGKALEIMPADGSRKITFVQEDLSRCLAALSAYARGRLGQGKLFNRLRLTLRGDAFMALKEYSE